MTDILLPCRTLKLKLKFFARGEDRFVDLRNTRIVVF